MVIERINKTRSLGKTMTILWKIRFIDRNATVWTGLDWTETIRTGQGTLERISSSGPTKINKVSEPTFIYFRI